MTTIASPVAGTTPATGPLPAVRLRGITKTFGDNRVVAPLDLDIRQNEFFSILGPSGCGKTTLMRMITGFETPTGGTVELDGRNVDGVPTRHRDLNMLFQSYALFPHLSVYENVAFELRVRRVPKSEIDDRVRAALELVRLGGFAGRKPAELSGGQRQRVALARAVVGRPAVVLLDEPLGALDQKLRKEMQFELKRMQREVGITFIYVTHDQEEALTMSDRIAVMSEGHVQQIGTPTEIYDAPASRFVAGFIGSCNLLEGTLTADGAAFSVPAVGDIPVASAPSASGGMPLTLAVRPERMRILHGSTSDAVDGPFALPATLSERVFMGDEWVYHLTLASGVVVTASVPSGPAAAALAALPESTRLSVTWDPADGRVVGNGVAA